MERSWKNAWWSKISDANGRETGAVKIFCLLYGVWTKSVQSSSDPDLPVEATVIPLSRDHCIFCRGPKHQINENNESVCNIRKFWISAENIFPRQNVFRFVCICNLWNQIRHYDRFGWPLTTEYRRVVPNCKIDPCDNSDCRKDFNIRIFPDQ